MPEAIKGNSGSGPTAYAWFVWDKTRKIKTPEVRWIEPDIIDKCKQHG